MTDSSCQVCGAPDPRTTFGNELLCEGCLNMRMSELTGHPMLPSPPAPLSLTGPDGRSHVLSFRIYRGLVGVQVELEERLGDGEIGYRFEALGNHDADVDELLWHVDAMARREIGLTYLERSELRSGWTMAEGAMEVAGRLECDEEFGPGGPYRVIVDGRSLTWEEFGQALESFEGWRFRLQIDERMDDLRPDAEVVAFPSTRGASQPPGESTEGSSRVTGDNPAQAADRGGSSGEKGAKVVAARAARKTSPASPNIETVLAEFLSLQEKSLAERTYRKYREIIELLQHSLNGYGYQGLDEQERALFEEAYKSDDEAFVHLFGPDKIVDNLGEFLGYFMVRKVIAGKELLRAAGTVVKKLVKWLGEQGYIDADEVAKGVERGADAARGLPAAERLSTLLYEASTSTDIDVESVDDDDWVEDYLTIARVEPGKLWFDGGGDEVGPVKVPKKASELAQVGWAMSATLARVKGSWRIVEAGRVYP